jgi:hypothetical protein
MIVACPRNVTKPPRRDSVPALLREDWLARHLTLQAMMPGLTPGQIKDLKRRERQSRQRRHFFAKLVREEVIETLARWEAEAKKKPVRPVQLKLPL